MVADLSLCWSAPRRAVLFMPNWQNSVAGVHDFWRQKCPERDSRRLKWGGLE
jgi:hypothetical protein